MDGMGLAWDGLRWAPKKNASGNAVHELTALQRARRDKRQESFICEPLKHAAWHCIGFR